MEIINTFNQSIAILCLNFFKINTVLILILQNKKDEDKYTMYLDSSEWGVSDCCLMPTQRFFSYTMARTS